jgi:hypothetical protein
MDQHVQQQQQVHPQAIAFVVTAPQELDSFVSAADISKHAVGQKQHQQQQQLECSSAVKVNTLSAEEMEMSRKG